MIIRPLLPVTASLVLAVAAGLLIGSGQAPVGLWPAAIIGVALFSWLMVQRRARSSFGYGYLAGLAMNILTVSWISVLGVWVGVALIAFLALWWGLLGLIISRLMWLRAWTVLVPAAWVAVEFGMGKVPFGGFSWTRLAFTSVDQPMSGWLAWVGATGVSYLIALVAQWGLLVIVEVRSRVKAIAAILAVFLMGGLLNLIPQSDPGQQVQVAIVQPNVNRAEKGTASYARSVTANAMSETVFALAQARTQGRKLDFILWPENSTDIDPVKDPRTRGIVETSVRLAEMPIFVGAVTEGPQPETRQTTSMWWTPEGGPGQEYHKRDLVPFGEWIPFRENLLPLLPILQQVGRQSVPGEGPGVVTGPVARLPDLHVGTIICFELAYDETSYDVIRGGAQVVVSQSNTNTYGDTFQPHQQLVINRVRAMELGRKIAVSTLNSVSAVVDARGQVQAHADEFMSTTLITQLPLRENVNLPVRFGSWTAWLAVLITVAGLASTLRRRAA